MTALDHNYLWNTPLLGHPLAGSLEQEVATLSQLNRIASLTACSTSKMSQTHLLGQFDPGQDQIQCKPCCWWMSLQSSPEHFSPRHQSVFHHNWEYPPNIEATHLGTCLSATRRYRFQLGFVQRSESHSARSSRAESNQKIWSFLFNW